MDEEPWTALRYRDGNEHSPANPFGRVDLTLWPDGRVRVEHIARPSAPPRVFEAQLDAWVLPTLFADLHSAGFPALPRRTPLPDGRGALLTIGRSHRTDQAWVVPAHRQQQKAVDRVALLLEAIAHAASRGALGFYAPPHRAVLRVA